MKCSNRPLRAAMALIAMSAATLAVSQVNAAELLEYAVLPSSTFSTGPTSGQFATGSNGVVTPFINKQPVQGFSAILPGNQDDTYFVMPDNGFGNKANSNDALLRLYAVRPNFKDGSIAPVNRFSGDELDGFTSEGYITLSDPWKKIPFVIVADGDVYPSTPVGGGAAIPVDRSIKANRYLTGSDFDIEAVRRAPDGTFWFGDELGPYLLHVDAKGRVLEAPIALPNFRKLPTTLGGNDVNPFIQAVSNPVRTLPANLPDSGGFEGMALNASGTKLYALLEKAVTGDSTRTRLLINEFSLKQRKYTGVTYAYPMDSASNAIGDFTALTDTEYLIIERDSGQGDASDPRHTFPARFKKIFKIDLKKVGKDGMLIKEEVADLMNVYDPRDVAGDGKTNTVFTFPFATVEAVLPLDNNRLLVTNDNNYPGSTGRAFGVPDNNEFIVIHTAPLLDCGKDKDDDRGYRGDDRGRGHGYGHHDRDDKECRPAKL